MSDERSRELLAWYDRSAREMPWRVGPAERAAGRMPDPYRVWLSEIMLQQTTVAAVAGHFERFTRRWPKVEDLAAADDAEVMAEWAGLGYYARARNLLKCARIVASEHGGRFPRTAEGLRALPGIGPYTAAAIAAIAHDAAETVVDGNVERVMARMFAIESPLPAAKPEIAAAAARLTPSRRAGDYAQAVMDLGATVCTPTKPACGVCPWLTACRAHAQGLQHALPRKAPKKAKPTRFGVAYVARRIDGAWLLERRPQRGLLGGMLAWPCTEWTDAPEPKPAPPVKANWRMLDAEVRHVFTHFNLRLRIACARLDPDAAPLRGGFVEDDDFRPSSLPTLMRKVHAMADGHLADPRS